MIPNKLFVYGVYTNGKVSLLMKFFIKYLQQIFPTIYQSSLVNFVGNKVKGRISKRVFQENKAHHTHTSYAHHTPDTHTYVLIYDIYDTRTFVTNEDYDYLRLAFLLPLQP